MLTNIEDMDVNIINSLNFKEFTYEKQTIIDYSSDIDFL